MLRLRLFFVLLLFGACPVLGQTPPASAVACCDATLKQARRMWKTNPAAALQRGRQALVLAQQLPDPQRQEQCLVFLATAADYAGEAEASLHYGQQALALAQQRGDSVAASLACHGLASTLADRHDTTSADRYLRLGLRLVSNGPAGYGARGQLLIGLATLDYRAGRFEQALSRALVARRLIKQAGQLSFPGLSSAEGLIAACYSDLGDERQAREIIGLTLARNRRREQLPQVVENLTTLSHSLLKDQPEAGLDTLQAALNLSRRLQLRERTLSCYREYFNHYAHLGRYQQAYTWLESYRALDDSLTQGQQRATLLTLNARYEARAREQQILALSQRNRIAELERGQEQTRNRLLLGLVALLALGLGGAATFVWKLKRRDQLLARQNAALHEATAAAQAHAAARDRLYAIVAHDLRGPVASFSGVSQLIELYLEQKDGAGLQQVTALVRQTARNLSELLQNLLGWTLSQTGELAYDPEHLLLAPLLAEIQHLYTIGAHRRRIRFELAPTPPGLHVWADSRMVLTIVRNLVGNALKFAPTGGHLRLSATLLPNAPGGPAVCLEVADNGSGMSAAQIQELLGGAPGTAPPPPTPDPRAGTGLGLSLCLAFVRRQGGTLTIDSEPGVGTTVRVCLPVQAPQPAALPAQAEGQLQKLAA